MAWPTAVQHVDDSLQAGSSTSRANTLGSAITEGNTLIAVAYWDGAGVTASITGWTPHGSGDITDPNAATFHMQMFRKVAGASESTTVTVNFSGAATYRGLLLIEFPAGTFVTESEESASSPGSGTDVVDAGDMTIPDNDTYIVGAGTCGGLITPTAGSAYASTGCTIDLGTVFGLVESGTVAAGTRSAKWSLPSNVAFYAQAMAFTEAGGDETAPTLSNPVDSSASSTTGSGSVDTDEGNGTLYWVVTDSATPPSAAQVKAGQDDGGGAAVDSGSQAVSGTGTQNISGGFTGLSPSTAYYAHYMHEDAATNQSTVSSGNGFTTDAAPTDIIGPLAGNAGLAGMISGAGIARLVQ